MKHTKILILTCLSALGLLIASPSFANPVPMQRHCPTVAQIHAKVLRTASRFDTHLRLPLQYYVAADAPFDLHPSVEVVVFAPNKDFAIALGSRMLKSVTHLNINHPANYCTYAPYTALPNKAVPTPAVLAPFVDGN